VQPCAGRCLGRDDGSAKCTPSEVPVQRSAVELVKDQAGGCRKPGQMQRQDVSHDLGKWDGSRSDS